MKPRLHTIDILILMAALLYACTPAKTPALTGTSWQLTLLTVDGQTYELNTPNPVTLKIADEGQIGGLAGCNQYFGTAEFEPDGSLEISDVGSTEMYCEQGMDVEAAFLTALVNAESWSTEGNADTLTFKGGAGAFVVTFQKLP